MNNMTDKTVNTRIATYLVTAIAFTLLYIFIRGGSWKGSPELHTIMEVIATLLALMVASMAMVRYYTKKEIIFLFLGMGFVGTALLDGYHAIVTSTYFRPFMPSDIIKLIPWSWVASRQFLSIMMVVALYARHREQKYGSKGRIKESSVYMFSGIFTLACFVFFAFTPLPRAHYPEFIFHRPEEFVPAVFFLIALVGFLKKGLWKIDLFEHWLIMSLLIGFIAQTVFMSFSGELFGLEFDIAHTLKKVSYICVLIGLFIAMYSIFQAEESSKAQLENAFKSLEAENSLRKEIEENLRTREKALLRSNQELEKFAYIASHDLQEPLRKIQAFGGRLAKNNAENLDDKGKDYLLRMRNAAERMTVLIGDLLSFSRVATHGDKFAEVNLDDVVDGVLSDLELAIEESNATINLDPLPTITGDQIQMRQLFQNLIGNAIKYKKPDDAPIIEINVEKVLGMNGENPNRGFWQIDVKDNGIGFDQQYSDKVFEIFQRLHGREEYKGTGIGLAIARRIAERHEGSIEAIGVQDEGATFTVFLPVDRIKTT
ncbi:MAG: hypothetical protein JKY04_08590 [Sneathiella sp.]|nr:hypothetical protein [Sneathiella sp.]